MVQVEDEPRFNKENDTTISVWLPNNITEGQKDRLKYMLDKIVKAGSSPNVASFELEITETDPSTLSDAELSENQNMVFPLSFQTLKGDVAIYDFEINNLEWSWCAYEVPLNEKVPLLKIVKVLVIPKENYKRLSETAQELLEMLSKTPPEEVIVEHKINVSDPTLDDIASILNVSENQEKAFFVFEITDAQRMKQYPGTIYDGVSSGHYGSASDYSSCSDKISQAPEAFYRSILFPILVRTLKSFTL